VEYFLAQLSARDSRQRIAVEPAALHLLAAYSWPGNVRELQNVCERAVVLAGGEPITAGTIEPWLRAPAPGAMNVVPAGRPGHLLEDMERRLIEEVLERHAGHRQRAARELGIGVRTLGLRLKRWREEAAA
jgi:two-component system response regulator AtoC